MKYIECRKQKTKAFERELNFIGLQEVQTKYSLILMGERCGEVTQKCFLFSCRKLFNFKINQPEVSSASR